ncbi:MAG: hypothetical protein WCK81_00660 [Betaproteobacteria bacterium]
MPNLSTYGDDGVAPLFFRVADRMRMEGYVSALIQDNMSLSMVSSHDAILDHYGKLLVARLREAAPHMSLEVCFPASADALITRFNEVLQEYSIEDAMGSKIQTAPPKIWIVHDASSLPDHEIQLLARLVQHFPGANIRVVMLLTTASQKQRLLASFGRRVLNWEIEPPTAEQTEALLEQARAQGREGAVSALLKKIAPASAPAAAAAPPEKSRPTPADTVETLATPPDSASAAAPTTRSGLRKALPWAAGLVLLLLACGLGVALLYGNLGSAKLGALEWQRLVGMPNAPAVTPPAPGADTASPAPGATTTAPANALGGTGPAADTPTANNTPPAPSTPPAPAAVAVGSPKALEQETFIPPTNGRKPATAAPSAPEVEEVITNPAQSQVGQDWIRQMPPGTFLVQHATVASYAEASAWLQAHGNLRRARIVANYLTGQAGVQFSVVSGPFKSLGDASAFVDAGGIPRDPQIRSARYMKEHFSPDAPAPDAPRRSQTRP